MSALVFAPGLTEREIAAVEKFLGVALPPDLAAFLAEGLPVGPRFPDWRDLGGERLRAQLDWPFDGIAFDIEHNGFWFEAWGPRPDALADAIAVARAHVAAAPKLIPLYAHRYLPAEPALAGNPVLSVYQTDIIVYGSNLRHYLAREFGGPEAHETEVRRIRFWSDLID